MDDVLTAVKVTRHGPEALDTPHRERPNPERFSGGELHSPSYIVEFLKSSPTEEGILTVLSNLDPSRKCKNDDMDIRVANSSNAHILQTLVSITIPDHWPTIEDGSSEERSGHGVKKSKHQKLRGLLLRCLCSIAGISALVGQLRTYLTNVSKPSQATDSRGRQLLMNIILAVISAVLKPEDLLSRLYADTLSLYDSAVKRQVVWRELLSLLCGGKLLSTTSEAASSIKDVPQLEKISWVSEGPLYAAWLGRNISFMVTRLTPDNEEGWKAVSLVLSRALSLGYNSHLVKELYQSLLQSGDLSRHWNLLFHKLRQSDQTTVLETMVYDLERTLSSLSIDSLELDSDYENKTIGGAASFFKIILGDNRPLQLQVESWLSSGQGGFVQSVAMRRSLILVLSENSEILRELCEKTLSTFGDKFYIKHASLQSQTANAQVLLLTIGHLNRLAPSEVRQIGRSGIYLNAISNRLAASSTRSRYLGMVVGMAVSRLVDEPDKAMTFDLEESENEEAQSYIRLVHVKDTFGSVDDLRLGGITGNKKSPKRPKISQSSTSFASKQSTAPSSKIIAIEEISDEEKLDEDEDLIPYEKPDSDASDSEEDATLVQRSKPTKPVYIRDLLSALKDSDNVDRYHLGITTGASLIRRKAAFGTELTESIEQLALVVVSLEDKYKLPQFHEHRLQMMIALLVAQPVRMGRWFTFTFFDADISQSQQSAILTALGLSARELAGYGEEDARLMNFPTLLEQTKKAFPSQQLPPELEKMYLASNESPVATLTNQMSRASLQPLALDAADALSGPNALKVRTFSSRMEVERQRQQRETQRKKKSTSEDLHKVLTTGYFYPLTGRFEAIMQSSLSKSITSSAYNPFLTPHLLRLFLQTITLILSTLGPNSPSLPSLTRETLTLLITLHSRPVADEPIVIPALLSLFLAIIDLSIAAGTSIGEERLVTEFATEVKELAEWVDHIFERMPGGTRPKTNSKDKGKSINGGDDIDDQERTRLLAAGIHVKLGEVMKRYQGRLIGINVDFTY